MRQAAAALAIGTILAAGLGEGLVRLATSRQGWARTQLFRVAEYVDYDPLLGHALRAAPEGPTRFALPSGAVTVLPGGWRGNGRPAPPGRPILVVGDSFTFGDQVADEQSWPAQLEARLSVPVVNGGVSAYGFDQTVLRAEALLSGLSVRGLVVALIPADIERCEYASLYAPKPYFEVVGDTLVLRNVPVPRTSWAQPLLRSLLLHSRLVEFVSDRLGGRGSSVQALRVHRDGLEVSARLVERVAALAQARGAPALLVIHGPPPRLADLGPARFPRLRRLMETAERHGLPALNLVEAAWQELRSHPEGRARWFLGERGHMSPEGNAWVAERVAAELQSLGWARR